eukprot:3527188-Pyramimonas_sp.AAC.1
MIVTDENEGAKMGFNMLGCCSSFVEWLVGSGFDIIPGNKFKHALARHVGLSLLFAWREGGLLPGLAMDLTAHDWRGHPWDFGCAMMKANVNNANQTIKNLPRT